MGRARIGLSLPIALFLSTGFFTGGCGGGAITLDASPPPDVAVTAPDAGPDASVDAGHVDANVDAVVDPSPEGGIVLVEYIRYSDAAANFLSNPTDSTQHYATRAIADFRDAQDPGLLFPPGTCDSNDNLIANKLWLSDRYDTVTQMDLGGSVTLAGMNEAGNPFTVTLARNTSGKDALGRPHGVPFYQFYSLLNDGHPLEDNDTADRFMPDSMFTLNTQATPDHPAMTYTDAVIMPPSFTYADLDNDGDTGSFTLSAANGTLVTWQSGQPGAAVLMDPNGDLIMPCPGKGGVMITPDAISSYQQTAKNLGADPTHVLLLVQATRLEPVFLQNFEPDNHRRLDIIGVYCYTQYVKIN